MKKVLKILLVIIVTLSFGIYLDELDRTDINIINAAANSNYCSYDLTWDLVDSGKHLDYDSSTKYSTELKNAVNTWNNYKSGVIRPDNWTRIQDVAISDIYNQKYTWAGQTSDNKTIKLNDYYMKNYSSTKKQNVFTHELGHALGLAHSNSSNVMYMYVSTKTSLGTIDKSTYSCVYSKEY